MKISCHFNNKMSIIIQNYEINRIKTCAKEANYEKDDNLRNSPFSYRRGLYRYAREDEGASYRLSSGIARSH